MRQALEMALKWIEKQPEETPESKYDVDTRYVVIREIEAALAQPEQKHDSAIKTLEHLKYTYHGGEYWKPPLGKLKALAQLDQDEVDIRSRLYQRIHELETQLARGEQDWIERERAVGYREGHQNALKQMAQPERSMKVEGPLHVVCQCNKCNTQPDNQGKIQTVDSLTERKAD